MIDNDTLVELRRLLEPFAHLREEVHEIRGNLGEIGANQRVVLVRLDGLIEAVRGLEGDRAELAKDLAVAQAGLTEVRRELEELKGQRREGIGQRWMITGLIVGWIIAAAGVVVALVK